MTFLKKKIFCVCVTALHSNIAMIGLHQSAENHTIENPSQSKKNQKPDLYRVINGVGVDRSQLHIDFM